MCKEYNLNKLHEKIRSQFPKRKCLRIFLSSAFVVLLYILTK
ncbi:hypothetical protein CLOBOL_00755 [Enterocloster bolteae ATCC BAA-613]|uniref:Uncharacterized protein n=1 Tax=Enterocloster bolteae (strain ATCC BAA-613 / DSM 15670 / CCUG 46953 / JCM 12243 / WAL 16351) TaxID=411902 RepID=A8RIQ2_ENTBW|nr:hypothetical protein CLOBOL_00755 [Enterocloster bolteae ATCC BAA-613]